MRFHQSFFLMPVLFISACHKDDAKSNPPAAQQTTGTGTGTTPSGPPTPTGVTPFIIFDDELRSGGGAFLYPSGENQVLSFADKSNPEGVNSIRYNWNGQDVNGQHIFTGFDLMHTADLNTYTSTPGLDLSPKNYSKVTFDARGTLPSDTVVKVEVSANGNANNPAPCVVLSASGLEDDSTGTNAGTCLNKAQLLSSWQAYRIAVSASDLRSVKDYFKATFIFKPQNGSTATGQGGTVYVDQIIYQ